MDKKEIFEILAIEPTNDEEVLKNAYRKKLLVTNPEDDNEGFKKLRTAYEEAVRLANETVAEDNTPIGVWKNKLYDIYENFEKRVNIKNFKELFDEDIVIALDSADEVREALLVYLMDHSHLTSEVWHLVGKKFDIENSKDVLYEKSPKGFIDFVISMSKNSSFIDFELFENVGNRNVDDYIGKLYSLKSAVETKNIEDSEKIAAELEKGEIYHPFQDVEKIKIAILKNNYDIANEICKKLCDRGYKNDYILSSVASAKFEQGDIEGAMEYAKSALEVLPQHYEAKRVLADCLIEKGDVHGAKKIYEELLNISSFDDRIALKLEKANTTIIEEYIKRIKNEPENISLKLDLGWCYYENKLNDKAVKLLEPITPVTDDEKFEYSNLLGRLYSIVEKNEKALPLLAAWYNGIVNMPDNNDEETIKRKKRKGYAIMFLSNTYRQMAKRDLAKRSECLKKALEYTEQKLDGDDLAIKEVAMERAILYKILEKYELSAECCGEIIESDRGYLPAYILRQEVLYSMGRGQDVIDDFYNILGMVKNYAGAYYWAVCTYLNYNMYDKAKEILELAKENGVAEKNDVKLAMVKYRGATNHNDPKDDRALIKECEKIIKSVKAGKYVFSLANVYYQKFIIERFVGDGKALNSIEKAIEIEPARYMYYEAKIEYLVEREQAGIAMTCMKKIIDKFNDNDRMLYLLGYAYRKAGKPKEAEEELLKSLAIEPKNTSSLYVIMDIYEDKYRDNRNDEDLERALGYADRQIEVLNNTRTYINKGLLYMIRNDIFLARECFEKALECGNDDAYSYHYLGNTYKIDENFEKALECYKKALEICEEETPYYITLNCAKCYECMREYGKSAEMLEALCRKYTGNSYLKGELARVYMKMKKWKEAIKQCKAEIALNDNELYNARENIAICYSELGKKRRALKVCGTHTLKGSGLETAYRKLRIYDYRLKMEHYFYVRGNYFKAKMEFLRGRMGNDTLSSNAIDYWVTYMAMCHYTGKTKGVDMALATVLKIYQNTFGGIEQYLKSKDSRKSRLFSLGKMYFYGGDLENAKKVFNEMFADRNCWFCEYSKCIEAIIAQGLLLEAEGKYEEAIEKYKIAVDEGYDIHIYKGIIRILNEKVKK